MNNLTAQGRERVELFDNKELGFTVRAIMNEDGSISVDAEDTARGLGWVDNNKCGTTSVRWRVINSYIEGFGFDIIVKSGDYIPESLFYMLAMKSQSTKAKDFKVWLANEVIPSVRRHGAYMTSQTLDKAIKDPNFVIGLLSNLQEERNKTALLQQELERQAPMIGYYTDILKPGELLNTTQIAKDLGMTAQELHKRLKEKGIMYKSGNSKSWVFYAKYQDRIPEYADYEIGREGQFLKWTEKGREWIIKDIFKLA